MKTPLMKCGHSANAEDEKENPCCAICTGINADADKIAETPNLKGRKAKCTCGKIVSSSLNLAFFQYCLDREYDRYYCGCYGWD